MITAKRTISLTDVDDFDVAIHTLKGVINLRGSIANDGALVLFIDTTDNDEPLEPTPDVLRVNVNDGPVFNYDDAVNWYGEEQGYPAPTLADLDRDEWTVEVQR